MKDSRTPALICIIILTLTLSACAPYRPAGGKAAYCNQLNSQMVFEGSTASTYQENKQIAEGPMVARTFENHDCI